MPQKTITNFFTRGEKRIMADQMLSPKKKFCNKVESGDGDFQLPFSPNKKEASQLTPRTFRILNGEFGSSWHQALKAEFCKPYFQMLKDFIEMERKTNVIYPPESDVFSWTLHCSMEKVNVVILGQDPYHGPMQAHGLAFSVKRGVNKPPSLVNIFKEVKNDYPNFEIPPHGDLTGWARQGVLLLNACLTVRRGEPNSHANRGWEEFTDAVIKNLANSHDNRVFMLWGNYAQKKGSFINPKKHLVLKTVHPSPFSANRGFLGCGHFKKANDYLKKSGKPEIDWTKLD